MDEDLQSNIYLIQSAMKNLSILEDLFEKIPDHNKDFGSARSYSEKLQKKFNSLLTVLIITLVLLNHY